MTAVTVRAAAAGFAPCMSTGMSSALSAVKLLMTAVKVRRVSFLSKNSLVAYVAQSFFSTNPSSYSFFLCVKASQVPEGSFRPDAGSPFITTL